MGQIEVIKRNGTTVPLFRREPDYFSAVRSAQLTKALMGDDYIKISVVSSEKLEFSKGDKIVWGGDEYFLRTVPARTIQSENLFLTELTFYGVVYDMMKSLYRNTDANGRSSSGSFDLTYSLNEFVKVIIYNLNRDYSGMWAFDEENCPVTEPKTMSFRNQNCLNALQTICKEFDYEFVVRQNNNVRTIHIGKFGNRVAPPSGADYFEWGKGRGLFSLKEDKVDDKAIITRLWIEGGSTNVRSSYRDYAGRLQLPCPKRWNTRKHKLWDGTIVEPGTVLIGIDDDNKRYIEDVALRNTIGSDEDGYQNDEIYPKRTGTVTAMGGDEYSFIDETMDFDLNETLDGNTLYLVDGVSAKVTFTTGRLAGQEFELEKYDPETKKFTLIPYTDERGLTVPTPADGAFPIRVTDEYKLTDIFLPEKYEQNAEEDLWFDGLNQFKPRTQARVQYSLTLDRAYFMDNLPSEGEVKVFDVGDYAPIKDERFGVEKNIRITKLTRNLMLEQDYQLTLADEVTITAMTQTMLDVINHEQVIQNNRLRDLSRAKRGWRTTEELRNMVYDTDGYFDVGNIRPNSIDTNMLTVGSRSQQYVLSGVVIEPNYQGQPNVIHISDGVLCHLTASETEIRTWNMSALEQILTSNDGYYVFAKCPKSGDSGTWYVTTQQMRVENQEDPDNFYFQVGILGTLKEGETWRDFVTTYGFTRINGNTITTGKIVTSDGECYLDLDGNRFRIGDSSSWIDWNVGKERQLGLHNVVLVSDSGETSPIGVYRGVFNSLYTYYCGDEVSYTKNGETYTIRYINNTPSSGSNPEDSNFWAIVARGGSGEVGNSVFYTFHDQQSQPSTPTGAGNTDGWHTNSTQSVIWMSVKSAKTINDGTWGIPFRVRGADGTSISIKGTLTSVSQLPVSGNLAGDSYLISGFLYIWDDTTWQNVGQIKGDSSYLHLKYSNDGGETFTDGNGETPGQYIGILVDTNSQDSDNPSDYKWHDSRGEQGIPGEPGEDGRTSYLHIKYSNDGGLSLTSNNGEDPGDWIGQYTDFELMDSGNPSDYTWSRLKGEPADGGVDATTPEFYEYRYAKNGSTTTPPDLDKTAIDPAGWSLTQPPLDALEYLWMITALKNSIGSKAVFTIPVSAAERLADKSGNGHNGIMGSGAVCVEDGERICLKLVGDAMATIPKNLPFGTSFTLCFFIKTDQNHIQWLLNGFYGREFVEKKIDVTADTWYHLAFRFNGTSLTVFKNGIEIQRGAVSYGIDGFSLYDGNLFESTIYFDEVRLYNGALSDADINKVMAGTSDGMIRNWSDPVRTTPYDAISVHVVDVEYAISDNSETPPASGWQTDSPAWQNGKFIWSRTKVEYTRGEPTYSNPVCVTGKQGNTGKGVVSITEQYYKSTSATGLDGGEWSYNRPEWEDGFYIWTRSEIIYSDKPNTPQHTEAICVTGHKGNNGDPGKDGLSVNNNLLDGTGFEKNLDKWKTNTSSIVDGISGAKAATGTYTGSGAKTILSQPINGSVQKIESDTWYTLSFWAKGSGTLRTRLYATVVDTACNGFVDNVEKELTSEGAYDWSLDGSYTFHTYTFKTKTELSDNVKNVYFVMRHDTTVFICMPKLEKGKDATAWCLSEADKIGAAFSGTDEYYKWHNSGMSAPGDDGWTKNAIPAKPEDLSYKYLWNYEVVHKDDGTTLPPTAKHVIGSDGKEIKDYEEYYQLTSENTAPAADNGYWVDVMIEPTESNKYLWNKEVVCYTDGTTDTKVHLIAKRGNDGQNGTNGVDGVSYTGTDEYYKWHNSGMSAPGDDGWTKNAIPAKPEDLSYKYLWNYEVIHKSKGADTTTAKHLIGSEGKGISSVAEYYMTTESFSKPAEDNASWAVIIPEPTSASPYLWNKEVVSYNDGTSSTTIHLLSKSLGVNMNLLDGSGFEANLNKWTKKDGVVETGMDGCKAFYCCGFIVDVDMEFAAHTSTTTAPQSGWTTGVPSGNIIWGRLATTIKADGSTVTKHYDSAFLITNQANATITKQWYLSTSGVSPTGGSWSGSKKEWSLGKRVWMRCQVTYPSSDGTKIVYTTAKVNPQDWGGNKYTDMLEQVVFKSIHKLESDTWYTLSFWAKGKGSLYTYIYPSAIDSQTGHIKDGTEYDSGNPKTPTDGMKEWSMVDSFVFHSFTFKTKETITDADQKILFRVYDGNEAHVCMPKLEKGMTATSWCLSEADKVGVSYKGTNEYYQWHTNGATPPAGTWTKNTIPPKPGDTYKYLWNYEEVTDSNGGITTTSKHVVSSYGKEIRSFDEYYMLTQTFSMPAADDENWDTVQQQVTAAMPYLWNKEVCNYNDGTSETPHIRLIARMGAQGAAGKSPALVYRGNYDSSVVYYGNANRVDAVKYNNHYYVARVDAGSFINIVPTNTGKWNDFGAQFESVATQILLAEFANIGGFIFKDNTLVSQVGTINGAYSEEYSNIDFVPAITLDGNTGKILIGNMAKLSEDGLSLLDNDGRVCAKLSNENVENLIVDSGATSGSGNANESTVSSGLRVIPIAGWQGKADATKDVYIGDCYLGGEITVNKATFTAKSFETSYGGSTFSWGNLYGYIDIICDGVVVKSFSNYTSGNAVTVTASNTIRINGSTYPEGRYRIHYRYERAFTVATTNGTPIVGFATSCSLSNATYSYKRNVIERMTLIGSNGFLNKISATNYILSNGNGHLLRFGNYCVRLSNMGIQKSTDGGSTWSYL